MKTEELKDLLYEKFGAYSKHAYSILSIAVEKNFQSIHELVRECGYSFRFVREIIYTLDNEIILKNNEIFISNEFKRLLKSEQENLIIDLPSKEKFIKTITSIVENYTKHNPDLDHISALPDTCYDRADFLINNFDIEACNILFVGDHDLSSLTLALLAQHYKLNYKIFVVDIDDNVLSYIQEINNKYGLSIVTSHSDFIYSVPEIYNEVMDVVFTDPPYTAKGMGVFLNRSIQCMKNNPFSTLCISYKASDMSNMLGVSVQREIMKRSLYIYQIIPNFNRYYAAESLGYRSDLYLCKLTSASIEELENQEHYQKIYTHGRDAVEGKNHSIELNDVLESITMVVEDKWTERPIYLIDSSQSINYKSPFKINKLALRNFIKNTLNGRLNVNKAGLVIFDCTGFSESYQFRPLLLCRFNEYFCLFTKEQQKLLDKSSIIEFISHGYEIEKVSDGEVFLYRFKQISNFTEKSDKMCFLMLINVRSSLKNSFVKAITTLEDMSKNEARKLFDDFSLSNHQGLLLFHLPMQSINKLSKEIMSLSI